MVYYSVKSNQDELINQLLYDAINPLDIMVYYSDL